MRLFLIFVAVLIGLTVVVFFLNGALMSTGDGALTLLWGVRHRREASYHGKQIKLPWMWTREGEWEAWRTLDVRRARWGYLRADERITLRNTGAKSNVDQLRAGTLRMLHMTAPAATPELYRGNEWMDAHYECYSIRDLQRRQHRLTCFSYDGQYLASMEGDAETERLFPQVLIRAYGIDEAARR